MNKLYHTECIASIGVGEKHTQIAMTIGGKIVVVKIPSNDFKISKYSDDFREGDTLADWIVRNGKEVEG